MTSRVPGTAGSCRTRVLSPKHSAAFFAEVSPYRQRSCFEGQANFDLAQRGYSRDNRSDCKQVCIGLVVSRCGLPLGYEVFAGNTADVTTVEHIVETMENRYGKSDRIWVMDRGMVSEENIDFLLSGGRRYIVGTPKSMLKQFEAQVLLDQYDTFDDYLEMVIQLGYIYSC